MKSDKYLKNDEVVGLLRNLKRDCEEKIFSDVLDGNGSQYVDLVMSGGGVLGVALVGYTYALEEIGIRFLRIGGASAGAINALLLSAHCSPGDAKSERLILALADVNFYKFIDGNSKAKRIVEHYQSESGPLRTFVDFLRVYRELRNTLGLNPGEMFYNWLTEMLAIANIRNVKELVSKLQKTPLGLRTRSGAEYSIGNSPGPLAIVAADITTQTKVTFPKMSKLYWKNPETINPAVFVRASMSVPFFFKPLVVADLPNNAQAKTAWAELAGLDLKGDPPSRCYLVDGGVLSNFPINLFHVPRMPSCPTFGVKLGADQRNTTNFAGLRHFAWSIFDASRHCLDYDFIACNPDYKQLVACIDTKDANWLDFKLSEKQRVDLFVAGVRAADKFLRKFDWESYKSFRSRLLPSA